MKTFYKKINRLLKVFILIILIFITTTGGDCEKILTGGGSVPSEMVGNWKLIEQTGALQDICTDETINFQSNGVAVLTCPNSTAINRNYSVSNNVLTYTETSVSYEIQFLNSNSELLLLGSNVSRNLKYQKVITADNSVKHVVTANSNNSSEGRK